MLQSSRAGGGPCRRARTAPIHREEPTLWLRSAFVAASVLVAITYRMQGDYTRAIDEFDEALDVEQAFPEAHLEPGNTLIPARRLDEARSHFRQALSLRPNYAEARQVLMAQQGRFE